MIGLHLRMRGVVLLAALLALVNCSPSRSDAWIKPIRVVNVPVDVRKALVISSSSTVLSEYGPLAGLLVEMLPIDLAELSGELVSVDWSKEKCIWTFDTSIEEVRSVGSTLTIRFAHQEGTGMRFWFFSKQELGKVKTIKFN